MLCQTHKNLKHNTLRAPAGFYVVVIVDQFKQIHFSSFCPRGDMLVLHVCYVARNAYDVSGSFLFNSFC